MSSITRPGINPAWLQRRESIFLQTAKILNVHNQNNIDSLEYYAMNGESKLKKIPTAMKEVAGRKKWEDFVDSFLANYALYRLWNFEQSSIENTTFDIALAQRAFSAFDLSQMIRLYIHFKFPSRFNGRVLQLLQLDGFAYTALGFVIGLENKASRLARLQLLAYRQGFYAKTEFYPIFHFMMRIVADYLAEYPHAPQGESINEPIFNELYKQWQVPDAGTIAPICLAALDLHTYRSVYRDGEVHQGNRTYIA